MSSAAPITSLTVITDVDELTELGETYATMTDELAAMVENSDLIHTRYGRMIVNRLGALHVALDELTAIEVPHRGRLVQITNDVDDLRRWVEALADSSVTLAALIVPLEELHAALVDQVAAYDWRVPA